MSAPFELLDELRARGVELRANGDRLRFRPVGRVTPDLLARLREHKPELLAVLQRDERAEALPARADPGDPAVQAARGEAERLGVLGKTGCELRAIVGTDSPHCRWIEGDALARLPEPTQGLVCPRDGWTPASWAAYLRLRAARCDDRHRDLTKRYRDAARLLGVGETPGVST